ncbi:olfactory receptor 10J1-like [Denticeps clupeoides]|uniref:Olfactory receptor n=1 Tax=Denticeps clupeoides TaxID=299321 RepID=A0A8C4AFF9_9TELE|nr:olfactory receptor 10J1-like [Denticeps clupeoides]XP_028837674.1 olfactory receptor 10J1-like [Denticeps clupeoides]
MENETLPFYFYFSLYKDQGHLKYVYFLVMLTVYSAIIVFNVSIIVVVMKEKSLHEPMYIFISCLSFNSLYGTAGLFPRLSIDILSDSHMISRPACFTQIYVIYTYSVSELTILAVMAYDRYVAICQPLRYHSIMTVRTRVLLIVGAFTWPFFSIALVITLSARLPLCGRAITRLYCSNWSVVRLSCVPTVSNNALGWFVLVTSNFLPSGFILYTYIRILVVCQRSSAEFRGKALQTCLPHIVTFVTYSITVFCDIVMNRFELDQITSILALIFSLEFLVVPPVLNPLIYGLTLPEIRKRNQVFSHAVLK